MKISISHNLILIACQNSVCDFFMMESGKILRLNSHFCKKEFFCEADAVTDMNTFLQPRSDLMVEGELKVIQEVTLKKARKKPNKNQKMEDGNFGDNEKRRINKDGN